MIDEEINRAVAESVGARYFTEDGGGFWVVEMGGKVYEPFTKDLNAMHEVEKMITNHWHVYLFRQLIGNNVSATARQRAESYLRTISKWEDA